MDSEASTRSTRHPFGRCWGTMAASMRIDSNTLHTYIAVPFSVSGRLASLCLHLLILSFAFETAPASLSTPAVAKASRYWKESNCSLCSALGWG